MNLEKIKSKRKEDTEKLEIIRIMLEEIKVNLEGSINSGCISDIRVLENKSCIRFNVTIIGNDKHPDGIYEGKIAKMKLVIPCEYYISDNKAIFKILKELKPYSTNKIPAYWGARQRVVQAKEDVIRFNKYCYLINNIEIEIDFFKSSILDDFFYKIYKLDCL